MISKLKIRNEESHFQRMQKPEDDDTDEQLEGGGVKTGHRTVGNPQCKFYWK